jgi:hypothetical protein
MKGLDFAERLRGRNLLSTLMIPNCTMLLLWGARRWWYLTGGEINDFPWRSILKSITGRVVLLSETLPKV